jgi:hypothetical protein
MIDDVKRTGAISMANVIRTPLTMHWAMLDLLPNGTTICGQQASWLDSSLHVVALLPEPFSSSDTSSSPLVWQVFMIETGVNNDARNRATEGAPVELRRCA